MPTLIENLSGVVKFLVQNNAERTGEATSVYPEDDSAKSQLKMMKLMLLQAQH
jgi:hypothetical protein